MAKRKRKKRKAPEPIALERIEQAENTRADRLNLSRLGLTSLPPQIGALTNLERLEVSGNLLSSLPPEIGNLTNLRGLYLYHNQLWSLPPEIGALTNLRGLYLHHNRLSLLPSEIGALTNLETLYLIDNRLSSLPPELGQLRKLRTLRLDYNPLPNAIMSAAQRGTKELLAYLSSLKKGIPQYEAKVLLVGEGNVGKSCLLDAFQGKKFLQNRDTTHGIEIERVVEVTPVKAALPGEDTDRELILNFWDFGGQQVYRVTHQLFFSPDALYLLVWKPREGHRENAVEDWLERIRLRVGDHARVLIVATHRNERIPELDFPTLKARFGDVLVDPAAEVDNKNRRGIDDLKPRVAQLATEFKHCGMEWAPSWHAAMQEIRKRKESHVPYAEIEALCANHGLDATDTRTLIGMMHTLGHLVYYDVDRLRDSVVLDPEWVTKSIGYVLEDQTTRDNGGVLDHKRLSNIWVKRDDTGEPYDPKDYPFFLRLMELYDICYRIDEAHSLVGQLVPYERPDLPWEPSTPTDQMQMSLTCRMSAEAPGLIAWTTVRNHRWRLGKQGKHWRNGVFLCHEDGNEALIELVRPSELSITVRGPWPSQFMGLLRDSVERLLREEWKGMTWDVIIPCPGPKDTPPPCVDQGNFTLGKLQKAVRKKVENVQCQDCFTGFHPANLLLGHVPPTRPPIDVLEEIIAQFEEVKQFTQAGFRRLSAQVAENTRWILRTLISEARYGPRLFTLEPTTKEGWKRLKLATDTYKLTLWCEQPGHEHACGQDGTYTIDQPKDWLVKVGPLVRLVGRFLRVAAPIAAGAAGLPGAVPAALQEDLKTRLDFMDKLTGALLKDKDAPHEMRVRDEDLGFSRAEGAALREFHDLLSQLDKDRTRTWGGLQRVTTPAGDILWVCPQHYKEYDRGLPKVPAK